IVVIVIDGVTVCDVYHTDRLIYARAVDVFAREVVIAVVFGYDVTAVIYIPGFIAIDILFDTRGGPDHICRWQSPRLLVPGTEASLSTRLSQHSRNRHQFLRCYL
nr:hypothetical protein [Planctomycetota bacterium]